MPRPIAIKAAADALLSILVKTERERAALRSSGPIRATPFRWRDPRSLPCRDALDLAGLAADPIGASCRAELRRIGHALHAANPDEDMAALSVEIAEMDMSHAGWRAIVLDLAWAGIGDAA